MQANKNMNNRRSKMTVPALIAAGGLAGLAQGQSPSQREAMSAREERVSALLERAHIHDDHVGSTCLETRRMSILMSPDATAMDVNAVLDTLPDEEFDFFQLQGSRWTATASDNQINVGEAFTLTYSFIPDGVVVNAGGAGVASNLIVSANASFPGGFNAFRTKVRQAMERWGELTNITYVEVSDDGAAFGSAGALGARGDVRISGYDIGTNALAVNYYPQFGGDMLFDTSDFATFSNQSNDFRSLRNVVGHEHGHGLGLQHVDPQSGTKLMEPALNTGFDGPQEDDKLGAYAIYGDRDEPNAGIGSETFLGGPLRSVADVGVQLITRDEIALERLGEADWYAFTAFAGVPIAIRVEPVGTTYQQGPQNGTVTTVDARAARNLGLRLWRRVSSQTNQLQMLAQIDFNPAGAAEYHPPIPYTQAGYMLAEIYSTDNVQAPQRYTLSISNSAINPPVEPAELHVFDGADELTDSSTVRFDSTNVGQTRSRTLTIVNAGSGPLEFGPVTIAGPAASDYSFTLLNSNVAAGGSTSLALAFSPSAAGQRVAVVSMPNNDPDRSDFSFIVSGTAVTPQLPQLEITIDGSSIQAGQTFDFGDVVRTETETVTMVLRNSGNATLSISSVSIVGTNAAEFAASISNATLSPGASASSALAATPALVGARTAQLRIASNATQQLVLIPLTVNGLPQVDCNANGSEDAEDIASGGSADCDGNGVPDECQADSDGDGVIDPCDTCPNGEDLLDSDADGRNDCVDAFPNDPFDGQPPTEDDTTDPNANGNDNGDNTNNNGGNNDNNNGNGGADDNVGDDNGDEPVDENDVIDPDVQEMVRPFGCGFGAPLGFMLSLAALTAARPRRVRRSA